MNPAKIDPVIVGQKFSVALVVFHHDLSIHVHQECTVVIRHDNMGPNIQFKDIWCALNLCVVEIDAVVRGTEQHAVVRRTSQLKVVTLTAWVSHKVSLGHDGACVAVGFSKPCRKCQFMDQVFKHR